MKYAISLGSARMVLCGDAADIDLELLGKFMQAAGEGSDTVNLLQNGGKLEVERHEAYTALTALGYVAGKERMPEWWESINYAVMLDAVWTFHVFPARHYLSEIADAKNETRIESDNLDDEIHALQKSVDALHNRMRLCNAHAHRLHALHEQVEKESK